MLLKESKLVYQPAFFIVTEMKSSLRKSLTKTLGLDLVKRLLTATTSTCWKTDALRLQYKKPACKHLQAGFYVYESLWSQGGAASWKGFQWCGWKVSIPLKSGKCCKLSKLYNTVGHTSQSLWSQGSAARNACSVTKTAMLSIPLKSGKCCKFDYTISEFIKSSQSLWSQGSAARRMSVQISASWASQSLWSQGSAARRQADSRQQQPVLSIPLKSGKCCKKEVYVRKGGLVLSIPLKSGKCCKKSPDRSPRTPVSQSLWSQGSAASDRPRRMSKTITLNPFEVREVLQECFTKLSY